MKVFWGKTIIPALLSFFMPVLVSAQFYKDMSVGFNAGVYI